MFFTDVSHERAVRAFQKTGFWIHREGKHTIMTDGKRIILIPRHKRINPFTLRRTIRDAGLTDEEFKELL